MSTKEKIEIMQAYVDGEDIQFKHCNSLTWETLGRTAIPVWDWCDVKYRIKPQTVGGAAKLSGRERFYESNEQYEAYMSGFIGGAKWQKEQDNG